MRSSAADIAVLGAGLQGCGIALELAKRGHAVALFDQDERPMNRASRRNEGKIHLGLVYAMDRSLVTARLQLKGALAFHTALRQWLGREALPTSTGFDYVVAGDSLLGPAALARHYDSLQRDYEAALEKFPALDYLGARPLRLATRRARDEWRPRYAGAGLQAVFGTAERAIDTAQLAALVSAAVAACPSIEFVPAQRIEAVHACAGGLRVHRRGPRGGTSGVFRHVVNATWSGRLAIDQSFGLPPPPGWVHRLKYRVLVRLPAASCATPSATMVVGRYGDVVFWPDATAYLSWYPDVLRGWSHAVEPPAGWNAACRGKVSKAATAALARTVRAALGRWHRGLAACPDADTPHVDAGVIFAHGHTDVDDPGSGLHERARIGVVSVGNYHSVNSGKLTTAPLFAIAVADRVEGRVAPDTAGLAALLDWTFPSPRVAVAV